MFPHSNQNLRSFTNKSIHLILLVLLLLLPVIRI